LDVPVLDLELLADLLLKGEDPHLLVFGNSFSEDGHTGKKFRLMLTNPPFGVEWKKVEYIIRNEYEAQGFDGRFGAGLPRITDGSFLFLQHMLAKRFEDEVGSRIAIIFNGSPLFSGDAGSGESEIRRWIIENDWLEGIIALPDQMFYNTGINTYIWIVTNRKSNRRKGKVQLINATEEKVFWELMPKNLGSKRHRINIEQRARIISLYKDMQPNEYCKIFNNIDFGYRRIRVDRPLRLNFSASPERLENVSEQPAFKALTESKKTNINEQVTDCKAGEALQRDILNALKTLPSDLQKDSRKFLPLFEKTLKTLKLKDPLVKSILQALTERDEDAFPMPGKKTEFEPDSELRDYESIPLNYASSIYDENVPLKENVHSFFEREVLPYAKDAWIDEAYRDEHDSNVGVVGYEVNANRYFYKYISPSTPSEFDKRIAELANDIENLVKTRVGHAVTKGIKLNTKMKPSGVEWLGDVPAHWETRRLKFLVRIINGATPSSAEEKYWDGDIAWVTPEDLGRLKTITISETKRKITQEGYQSCGTTLAPSGSVVISTRAPIGYLAIAEMAICTNQGCRTLVVNKNLITSHYLYFSLLASRHILAVYGEGSTFKELGKSELANFTIALPPIEEQEEISRFLLSEINNIDIMVAKIEENIQLLLKQRSSIVSAAVTGKN
jgi:restriction endonuclease S subunit